MKSGLKLTTCFLLLSASVIGHAASTIQTEPTAAFISFSDIHFTPFASCVVATIKPCALIMRLRASPAKDWETIFEKNDSKEVATYSHDTNYALLKSSLAAIKMINQNEKSHFAFVLGDFLAHHFREQYILYSHDHTALGYQDFVKKTLQFLTAEIRQAIPNGDVYPVVGNNDTYTGDYSVVPDGAFLHDTAAIWSQLMQDHDNQRNMRNTFAKGGYYAVDAAGNKNQRILVLNTVLFSSSAKGVATEAAARNELTWLHAELTKAAAEKKPVLLAFHIPVGINVYKTLMSLFGGVKEFWRAEYGVAFDKELRSFPGTVRAILPGHIHMDSFQMIGLNALSEVPVSFTPSISPIFGNNPGFKVYSYNPETFKLVNYDTYFYSLDEDAAKRHWQKEYNFKQVYQSTCPQCDLIHGMKKMTPANELATSYKHYYAVGTGAEPISKDHKWVPYYWCDIFSITERDYQSCLKH
jgi:sphingomyelin phosphodiesterase acid-like 3